MNEDLRIIRWREKFYAHVRQLAPELYSKFVGRLFFSPAQTPDKAGQIYAGLNTAEEGLATQEERDRMFEVFHEFYRDNPV